MTAKDKIEISLKILQTAFIVIAGIIGLIKFSDYVNEQKIQREKALLDVVEKYYKEDLPGRVFQEKRGDLLRKFSKGSSEIFSEKHIKASLKLYEELKHDAVEKMTRLERRIHQAMLIGKRKTTHDYFCGDAYAMWLALGPVAIHLRRALADKNLFIEIERLTLDCGRLSKHENDNFTRAIHGVLKISEPTK